MMLLKTISIKLYWYWRCGKNTTRRVISPSEWKALIEHQHSLFDAANIDSIICKKKLHKIFSKYTLGNVTFLKINRFMAIFNVLIEQTKKSAKFNRPSSFF